jgi:amino acid transporter
VSGYFFPLLSYPHSLLLFFPTPTFCLLISAPLLVGFDVIATSAEEALNPSFSVPVGIIGSLLICACCYMGVAGIITLMVPYASISVTAPLPGKDSFRHFLDGEKKNMTDSFSSLF